MKLGDIKAEALKLMFVSYGEDITAEGLNDLGGIESFRAYLVNMNGSINRCFADIERRRILPVKSIQLKSEDGDLINGRMQFDLSSTQDFFDIDRLIFDGAESYDGDHSYIREGDRIIICDFDENANYRILYYPTIRRIDEGFSNTEDVPIPNAIAVNIPYFVKGDLYREDEPNEASEARNWYEEAMESIENNKGNRFTHIDSRYAQVKL